MISELLDLNIDTVFFKTLRFLTFFMYFASHYSEALKTSVMNFFSVYVRCNVNILNVHAYIYIYIYIYIYMYLYMPVPAAARSKA